MTNKNKKRLLLGLCCALVASTFPVGFSACFTSGGDSSNSSTSEMQTEKYEGSFYADKEGGEGIYELAFTEDGVITYSEGGNKKIGTFVKADKEFLIAFNDGTTASAELVNKNILFTYGDLKITFIEKIEYTVTFNVDGATTKVTKYNGQQVAVPEAPEKTGYKFVGWYMDQKYTKPYVFATPVTKDVTLYARFIEVDENAEVFTVNFVVDGKAYGEPVQTEAGIVAELPTPTKEGATFAGWWMSGSNEEAKLTAKYDGQMIQEDITLFAVWASDAPAVSVSEKGVVWTAAGQNNNYKVEITKPDGTKKSATLADNYYDYDFTAEVAGEYVVTVTLNGKTTTMYYQNKKLAKICKVEVDDSTSWLLKWNEIEGAEKYLVTIECGDAAHQHTQVEVTNPYYDFTNCTMQKGGVKLVVEAVAEGYTGSASDAYYFSKDLAAAATVQVEGDKTLTWTAVENAEGYKVEITAGDKTETVNVTGTNYSLENYTGALTFKVTPYAKGYNSPDVTEVNYTKVALAKPTGVKLTEQTVTWDAMAGATGYVVNVDGKTYTTTETKFDLMGAEIDPNATNCKVQVMATGATAAANSVYSNEITVTFGQMADTLTYKNGKVYWDPVINVTQYAVQINGGTVYRVDKAEHSYTPIFTSTGAQKISVRCYDAQGVASEWVHLTVTTAEVTFDAQNGEEVDPIYQVEGDVIALPEGIREGYTFDGWYTNPNGEGGDKFDSYTMTAEGANLFAHWTANKYKITLNLDGGEMEKTEVEVTYDSLYNLGIPTNPDTTKVFVGWYSEANGVGLQYADYKGNSLYEMKDAKNVKLYAAWKDAFVFTLDTDEESYTVKMVEGIDKYATELTVPVSYDGKPVTRIEADAFKSSYLTTVNIPNTIEEIFVGTQGPTGAGHAFYGCYYLENVNIYKVDGDHEVAYESIDGVLYKVSALDAETATKELIYFPRGKTYKAELATYAIPEGVTSIGMRVFYSAKIAKLTLPASLTLVAAEAFYWSDVKEIEFAPTPEGQEPVGLIIEESGFKYSDLLTKITLPARLENLQPSLFSGCSKLMEIHVEGNGKYSSSEDGILLSANGTEIAFFPLGRGGEYTIPEGIVSIADNAFAGCSKLTKLIIPNYVSYIGKEAFKSCSGLTEVVFQGTETDQALTIKESAFYSCYGLTELTLPANLAILEAHAFGDISNLKSVTMNTTNLLAEIQDMAFGTTPSTAQLTVGKVTYHVEVLKLGEKVDVFNISGVFGDKLSTVVVAEGNQNIKTEDGVLYDHAQTKILYYPAAKEGAYVTPATLTEIGANIFKGHQYLTSITISKNVTSIGVSAFESCAKLTEVIFEEGGTDDLTIGDRAFVSTKIVTLTLPERLTEIGNNAFQQVFSLTSIVIPSTLQKIGDNAFFNCNTLEAINLPADLTSIGVDAFKGCRELGGLTVDEANENYASKNGVLYAKTEGVITELLVCPAGVVGVVDVPKTVTKIADRAFYQNAKVTEITFSEGIEGTLEFGEEVFYNCVSLKKVTLPEGLTSIEANTFYYCSSLEEIVIPSTIKTIKNQAFYYCTNLSKLTFAPTPEGQEAVDLVFEDATTSDKSPFNRCSALTEISFPERTTYLGQNLFASVTVTGDHGEPSYVYSSLEKVYIPATVTAIGKAAFKSTPLTTLTFAEGSKLTKIDVDTFSGTQLTEITLPEGLIQIGVSDNITTGGSSFAANTKLQTVNLPSTLETLYYGSFRGCTALTAINFPNGCNLTYIGDNAFYGCTALEAIEIPASVETIGKSAFGSCSKLANITFAENTKIKTIKEKAFEGSAMTKFAFPETAESLELGVQLFNANKYLMEVHLSLSVVDIDNVFANCPALVKITIAEGHEFFKNHETLPIITNLTSDAIRYIYGTLRGEFAIPEGYTQISDRAFADQKELTKIIIPHSMREIGANAFMNCKALKEVEFADNSQLVSLGQEAFSECRALLSITLPDSLTAVPVKAFYNCRSLQSVTLGNNTKTIGETAFYYCYDLATIDVGDSLEAIGEEAFYYCESLKKLELPSTFSSFIVNSAEYDGRPFYNSGLEELDLSHTKFDVTVNNRPYYGVFYYAKQLKTVTLPENMTMLPNKMFYNCESLETVNVPSTLTEIGESAFYNCKLLTAFDLKNCVDLTAIGSTAFQNCEQLTQMDLSALTKLEKIGNSAFKGTGLTSIVLPDNVTSLGNNLFENCVNLTSVKLPDNSSLTKLGNSMFKGCTALEGIELPDSLTFLGTNTFEGSGLKKITIPSKVTQLGSSATTCTVSANSKLFLNCLSLTEVTFHDNLKKIGASVFEGCTSLKTLNNVQNVELIGNSAFRNTGLESINFPALTASAVGLTASSNSAVGTYAFADCAQLKEINIANLERLGNYMFQNCTALEKVEAPKIGTKTGAATHGTYAFQGCTNLKEVTLDPTLKYISKYMFDGCTSLTSITLPTALTTIGDYAFRNAGLKNVDLPATVTTINTYAFFDSAIEAMHLPAKVKTIGSLAFGNCEKLTAFTVDDTNSTYQAVQGALADKKGTLVCYPAGAPDVETLTLPEGTKLTSYAFYGCDNIKKLVLPQSMTTIPTYAFAYFLGEEVVLPAGLPKLSTCAFAYASNLKKVNIPEGITELPAQVFRGTGLESIVLPESLVKISGSYVFAETMLKEIVLPNSLTTMSTYAFDGCEYLETVTLPTGITALPNYTFRNCIALKTVNFANTLESIGTSAFAGCTSLKTLSLPKSLTAINSSAFMDCTALEEVTLPASLTTIGDSAFKNCTALATINFPQTLTSLGASAFQNTGFTTITIPATVTSLGTGLFKESLNLETVVLEEGVTLVSGTMFQGCTALKNVTLPSTLTEIGMTAFAQTAIESINIPVSVATFGKEAFKESALKSIELPNGYAKYNQYMFQNCTALETVILSEGMKEIPGYMFEGCSSLKNITLPSSLETIAFKVFWNCTSLETLDIPDSVISINWETFLGCTNLKSIVIPAGCMTFGRDVFSGWTAEQTIYFVGEEWEYAANGSFNAEWDQDCAANIVWGYQPQA